jgi:acetyl/propionyl-CoA carboxylase alpha subunit
MRRVLVANRGEIARRVFRACRKAGLATVAVYSEADTDAPHVRDADQAIMLGPPPARESYLDVERLIHAARRSDADAVHPGYGFLSENWRFADAVTRAGLTFIGPPAEAVRAMGDKTEARRLMAAAGVSTMPGSPGPISDPAEAETLGERIGFPLVIKAASAWCAWTGPPTSPPRSPPPRGARSRPSPTRPSTSSAISSAHATWRSRSSPTPTAASCTCTSASAPSSGATRS